MGIKKIIRPINKAKNQFIKYLQDNKAESIDEHKNDRSDHNWDYYAVVSGFISNNLYTVYFTMFNGQEKIDYSDSEFKYRDMTVEEFLQLIN